MKELTTGVVNSPACPSLTPRLARGTSYNPIQVFRESPIGYPPDVTLDEINLREIMTECRAYLTVILICYDSVKTCIMKTKVETASPAKQTYQCHSYL